MNSLANGTYVTDDDELSGVRELLAIVQASSTDTSAVPPASSPAAGSSKPAAPGYPNLSARQRSLLPAFLETQDRLVAPADLLGFSMRVVRSSDPPQGAAAGSHSVPVRIEWSLGDESSRRMVALFLPLSPADDRRDRTRVQAPGE